MKVLNPLFSEIAERRAGVLLHPTCLPGDHGIGNLGRDAYRFVDFLEASGLSLWQMCPTGPTGFGDSPYQSFSSFAGNPYLIDLNPLVTAGLLDQQELSPLQKLSHDHVDYGALYETFWPILRTAFERGTGGSQDLPEYGSFAAFKRENAEWLEGYAYFSAIKEHFNGMPWYGWSKDYRTFGDFQKFTPKDTIEQTAEAYRFYQYLFFSQWKRLRAYAASKGVQLIGDVPIFVALDSADVWQFPEYYQLDKTGQPTRVAGVPPDYFSASGQLWGNPLYDWDKLAKQDYRWWLDRLKMAFDAFDWVRLDHFRGFQAYWSIPAGDSDARGGQWVDGPGIKFFEAVKSSFPNAKLIAEDLGEITPDVRELLAQTGLPGMGVLHFAFGGDANNPYLPHMHVPNLAAYPGLHDNDTSLGWYESADEGTRDHFRRYFSVDGSTPQWDMIRACYRSPARLAVIAMQDFLNLPSSARMNTPGTAQGNWQWRFRRDELDHLWRESAGYLYGLAELFGRK